VHVRGEDVAVDVVGALRTAGFEMREAIVYRATRARVLSQRGATHSPPRQHEIEISFVS